MDVRVRENRRLRRGGGVVKPAPWGESEDGPCCDAPLVWVAGEAHSTQCHARLERCATCEGHRLVSWWDPPPAGWVSAMARHSAELRRQAVLDAFSRKQRDVLEA